MVSKPCGKHKDGVCPCKTPHTSKECPTNKWGINKDKTVSDDGATLLCTHEMTAAMFDEDYPVMSYIAVDDDEDEVVLNNSDNDNNIFYLRNTFYPFASDHIFIQEHGKLNATNKHIFVHCDSEKRNGTSLSQLKGGINKDWILLDSQSTVDLFPIGSSSGILGD